jgi:hypothetical protein
VSCNEWEEHTESSPSAHLTDHNEDDVCLQSIERNERMFRYFELDPEEHRKEQEAHSKQGVDVRLLPTKARCLVPSKVEQYHSRNAYCCAEQVELMQPLCESEALLLFFEWDGG